ncbi:AP-3 complex subunit delta [Typha latifolia]|uniref:AP-3 complex subunit delta n=1 Tax=Typha latifolia TaxID=4733 RepID=UPI003C2F3DDB
MATSSSSSSPSLVDSLFQRSLDDLIKSIHTYSSSSSSSTLISHSLSDIRREIRSPDPSTKSVALQKLTFLSSLHFHSMSWAAFHALELLPSSSLPIKRLAYLAASLSFHPSTTDLLPLTTHQLHKDLTTFTSPFAPSLPLYFISLAASPDIATHLAPDLVPLISRSSQVQSKAIAAATRVISLSPSSVPLLFKPLVDCLADPRAVSAAVGVFCELSAPPADPGPFLPLAPEFYRILLDSKSNWVLIKVLKIFARLAPLEPRLAARIVDPICQLMRRSSAKSLVFECVRTVSLGLSDHGEAVRLAIEKIKEFMSSDDDPNLRYLGLQALAMLGPEYSWAVEDNRVSIVRYLTDTDHNIRSEALRLLIKMVSESNIVEISDLLVGLAAKSDPEFANEILETVLATCGRNVYELVVDFDWYVGLLGEMARNIHCAKGEEIEQQLVDIGLRVKDARPELVHVARDLLIDPALLGNQFLCSVLSAAAWASGEYVEFSRNPLELVEALLQPRTNLLPTYVRAVYIQAIFKVLTFCCRTYVEQLESSAHGSSIGNSITGEELKGGLLTDDKVSAEIQEGVATSVMPTTSFSGSLERNDLFTLDSILYMLNLIETAVGPLALCDEVEVQERARNVLGFVHMLRDIRAWKAEEGFAGKDKVGEIVNLMDMVFSEELGPVSVIAQKRVPVPEGLILKETLADLTEFLSEDDSTTPPASISFYRVSRHTMESKEESATLVGSTSLLAEHRKRHGLYYLPAEKDENESNDYPHANDPLLPVNHDGAIEDLVKLTEQALVPRKTKNTKPRPTVVKLDEGEGEGVMTTVVTTVKESKEDPLSGVIRGVLLGKEDKPSSSEKRYPDKSYQGTLRDKVDTSALTSQLKENLLVGDKKHEASSTRKSRKERHRSTRKNEEKEEKSLRSSTRSSHHHGKHKHRQRVDASLSATPQAPVIQDFLL